VASLAINASQRRVRAAQAGNLFEGFVIKEEGAAILASLDPGLGHKRGHIAGLRVGFLQRLEGAPSDSLIAHPQAVPDTRVLVRERGQLPELHGRAVEAPCFQLGLGQHAPHVAIGRLYRGRFLERCDG
jgi:hypothetical protein